MAELKHMQFLAKTLIKYSRWSPLNRRRSALSHLAIPLLSGAIALSLWMQTAIAAAPVWSGTMTFQSPTWSEVDSTANYPTKAQAVAAMLQLIADRDPGGMRAVLQEQDTPSSMSPTTVTYKYVAPTVSPFEGPDVLLTHNGTGFVDFPLSSNSDSFVTTAVDNYFGAVNVSGTPCPAYGAFQRFYLPVGSWTPVIPKDVVSWSEDQITYQQWYMEGADASSCQAVSPPSNDQFSQVGRIISVSCPQGYVVYGAPSAPTTCANYYTGTVTGPLLECPKNGGPSTQVGDPCDVSTGDFSQSETDYTGAGLSFSRYYHSATLESHHMGVGWTSNYSMRLVMDRGAPVGLLRPDGHQDALLSINQQFESLSGAAIHVILNSSGQWTALMSDGSSEVYSANGYPIALVTAGGASTTLVYNASNQLVSVSGPFGHTLQFSYDQNGNLQQVTDPAGQAISYTYDANGNLTSVAYQDSTSRTYLYENSAFPNNLTGITDESGTRYSTVQYDPTTGWVTSSQQAGGAQAVSIAYSASSTTVTDALGAVTTYEFTTDPNFAPRATSVSINGLNSSYAVPDGATDPQRRVTQTTDPKGNVTTYSYDANHLISKTEAYGTPQARTTNDQYLSTLTSLPTSVTGPLQQASYTYFSATNNVQTKTITDLTTNASRVWTYTYDSYGRVLTAKDPRGGTTAFAYYTCTSGGQCGQLQTATDAAGHVTTYSSYNAHGLPLSITDPNSVVTTLSYDLRQRLTSQTTAGEITSYSYYPTGLSKTVTLPDNSYLQYTYDNAHRLVQVTDGAGSTIAYTLDAAGNRTAESTTDPSGVLHRTHSRIFNMLNQLYQDVNASGTAAVTTTYGYDNDGNLAAIVAPVGRSSAKAYDSLNRLSQITDPASGVTQFAYDSNNNLVSVVDPRSLTTTYTYSGLGDLVTQNSPDTGSTTKSYDSAGNLTTSTDARGAVTTYGYDALNRPTSAAFQISGVTDQAVTFTYDSGTNGMGHLTGASDANHSLSWTYDPLGRVTGKIQTVGSISEAVAYAYTNGDLTSMTTPAGRTVTYGYNANHQIISVAVNGISVLSGVGYEPLSSAVNGWTWSNGTATTRTFDTDGDISSISSSISRSYSYDNAQRIIGITDNANDALSWSYGYDGLDRLSSASASTQSLTLSYDANGNRLTQSGSSGGTYSVGSSSNRLNGVSGAFSRTYYYDAAGHTLAYGALSFTYNAAGLQAAAINGSTATTYVYNAFGQRIEKVTAAGNTVFLYDESGHLIGEYDGTGTAIQEIIWLGDIPVATVRQEACGLSVFYIHTDHLNTPRRITRRTTSDVVWSWDSDPFGATGPNENPSGLGTFSFNLRFPGQYYDAETGLNYNFHRYYDPESGRYIESDPKGLIGGINTYAYVRDNALSYLDPSGLFSLTIQDSWATVSSSALPMKDQIGGTGYTTGASCHCTCSKSSWTLVECTGNVYIQVGILAGLSPEKDAFSRHSEAQHVLDFADASGRFRQVGESIEQDQQSRTFTTQKECEQSAAQRIADGLAAVAHDVYGESARRYDYPFGPHTYYPWYNPLRLLQ